jgi:small subunit ribosomal protein S8
MTDPISDLLTCIRNAHRALLPDVEVPHSRLKESVARILKQEGYIQDCSVDGKNPRKLRIRLKYAGRQPVINGLRRVSKPGLRHYTGSDKVPRVLGGLGTAILTTSRGVMTGVEARKQRVGGEVLCYVW